MVQDLGILQDMDATQYSRYRDTMNDWYNDRNFAYGMYRDDVGDYQWGTSFNYNANRDNIADQQWNKTFDYNAGQDALAQENWEKEFDYGVSRDQVSDTNYGNETAYNKAMDMLTNGVMPDAATLQAAGISEAEATAYVANWNSKNTKKSSGGGGGDTAGDLDYEGLFQAALASGNPKSWLAQKANYKAYGFTSSTGLYDDYEEWLLNQDDEEEAGGTPDTIGGKSIDDYEAAAGNYQEMAAMCAETYKNDGKEKTLELLREAYKTGALNLSDYSALYSKYRDMT